ncbi:MAG TPA: oxidoreductase-like domain-containing protein [Noviherbaspirillum sp.]
MTDPKNFPTDEDSPPIPPERPGDDECCHSGCDPCVFDWYAQALERYRADLRAWEERRAPE